MCVVEFGCYDGEMMSVIVDDFWNDEDLLDDEECELFLGQVYVDDFGVEVMLCL